MRKIYVLFSVVLLVFILALFFTFISLDKEEDGQPSSKKDSILDIVDKSIYNGNDGLTIEECSHNNASVYHIYDNSIAVDAPSKYYGSEGSVLGTCNVRSEVSPICGKAKDCEIIYRQEDNLNNEPFIDKYSLDSSL